MPDRSTGVCSETSRTAMSPSLSILCLPLRQAVSFYFLPWHVQAQPALVHLFLPGS